MRQHAAWMVGLGVLALASAGCATIPTPMLVQTSDASNAGEVVFEGRKILLVPPALRYADVNTERELPPGQRAATDTPGLGVLDAGPPWSPTPSAPTESTASAMSNLMVAHAQSAALQQGFEVISAHDVPEFQGGSLGPYLSDVSRGSGNLLKTWSKDREQLVIGLQVLKEATGADAVLLQATDTKVGQAPRWDAMSSGRVLAGTSRSDLTVGLVDTTTGAIVWKQEGFYRGVLNMDTMSKLLQMVFEHFPRRRPDEA